MYSSWRAATHHVFFPPRLEVVVEEQNSDGFPSHARNQFSLHGFLYHQPHGPASAARWRATTDHGADALLPAVLQRFRPSLPLLFLECTFEYPLLVPTTTLSNRLCDFG